MLTASLLIGCEDDTSNASVGSELGGRAGDLDAEGADISTMSLDAGAPDAVSLDATPLDAETSPELDAESPRDAEPVDEPDAEPEVSLSINLDTPADGMSFSTDDDIVARGVITVEGSSLEFVGVDAVLDGAQSVPILLDRSTGVISLLISAPTPGEHTLNIRAAIAPDHRAEITRRFTISCPMINEFDEPLDPLDWVTRGPAIRDDRGWLELTQNQLNTSGAIFWAGSPVSAGDLDLEFSFSTSKCDEPGPCDINRINAGGGFSINFWDVSPQQLDALWDVTRGLGHVTPQPLLDELGMSRAESFHVVFDTYSNTCTPCGAPSNFDGCGNQHEEPTTVNHVSLLFNGHKAIHGEPDASGSYCHLGPVGEEFADRWTAFPELDDGEWHHAHLTISGTQIELSIDDQSLINADLPNLRFKGGILSIAAGSGVNGNFHRVDQLRINDRCH